MTQEPFDVYTLGFSNRTWEQTEAILRAWEIGRVIDIRTVPRSKHTPQFDRDTLSSALAALDITYVHLKSLGGFRVPRHGDETNAGWRNESFRGYADYMQTPDFEQALERLVELFSDCRALYACTEAVYWRCHRSLVSDTLVVRGRRVGHILGHNVCKPHALTRFARVDGLRITYPE